MNHESFKNHESFISKDLQKISKNQKHLCEIRCSEPLQEVQDLQGQSHHEVSINVGSESEVEAGCAMSWDWYGLGDVIVDVRG